MHRIGYCLWCGAEIAVAGYSNLAEEIEWDHCKSLRHPCKGSFITVVTDLQGFVIHPYKHRGEYIFSRKQKQSNDV